MIIRAEVETASRRIAGWIRRTPVAEADPATLGPAGQTWFKLKFMQHSGSFKTRGAFNRILTVAETGALPAAGVIAASGGSTATFAALLSGSYRPTAGERIAIMLCGANTDPADLAH
ncbi:MAG: pyridoxal-phosphate dependent enzyme [Pseudonocardiaceae bacterium]